MISETDWGCQLRYTYFPNLAGRRVFESSVGHFGIIWFSWLEKKRCRTEITHEGAFSMTRSMYPFLTPCLAILD